MQLSAKTPYPADAEFTARVRHAGGEETVPVRPRHSRMLGTYVFAEEKPAFVEFAAAGSRGNVIADAIEFVPVEE